MADDLVARLRTMAETGWSPIGNEAADEIERLRSINDAMKIDFNDVSKRSFDRRIRIGRIRAALNADEQIIRLHLGEMTPQEMRNVKAALAWVLSHDR